MFERVGFYNLNRRNDNAYILIVEIDGVTRYRVFSNLASLQSYVVDEYFYTRNNMNHMEAMDATNLRKKSCSFNQFHPDGATSKVTISVVSAPFTQ